MSREACNNGNGVEDMTAEIERFLTDARADAGLQAQIAQKGGDIDALVGLATTRGYKISRADADAYIAAHKPELSDDQLDHVAGGGHKKKKGGGLGSQFDPDGDGQIGTQHMKF